MLACAHAKVARARVDVCELSVVRGQMKRHMQISLSLLQTRCYPVKQRFQYALKEPEYSSRLQVLNLDTISSQNCAKPNSVGFAFASF